jgi:hypothetical protein
MTIYLRPSISRFQTPLWACARLDKSVIMIVFFMAAMTDCDMNDWMDVT